MQAMVLRALGEVADDATPLALEDFPKPVPEPGEVLLQVAACGVCHTELDEIEGRAEPPRLPVIPGHQVVGKVVERGAGVSMALGTRIGVGWIGGSCGECGYCRRGLENLCTSFVGTGCDINGGYAQYMTVRADFVHPIPEALADTRAAPMLCAGAIGYRSLKLTGLENGQVLGLTGFGGSGHLVLQLAKYRFPDSPVYVFARREEERQFARELGADWAGDTRAAPPHLLDAVIDTTPAWLPDVAALENLAPGGRLVINAIRKQDGDKDALLDIQYQRHLWMEREIKSVANVTRDDIREFLALAAEADIHPEVELYELAEANRALVSLKFGRVRGAKVLTIGL